MNHAADNWIRDEKLGTGGSGETLPDLLHQN